MQTSASVFLPTPAEEFLMQVPPLFTKANAEPSLIQCLPLTQLVPPLTTFKEMVMITRVESDCRAVALRDAFMSFEANLRLYRIIQSRSGSCISKRKTWGKTHVGGTAATTTTVTRNRARKEYKIFNTRSELPTDEELEELERWAVIKARVEQQVFQADHDRIVKEARETQQ
ncbi:UNVERIFIED_CONTAM: hypothetical protein HDU68_012858 [Siphonaria sp. JEL0065]|nr:hypothetical protein HDU68_012858 [Siphonaria sp. JEL0065]